MMDTQNKKSTVKKKEIKPAEKPKRMSKTWEAFLKNEGKGRILDLRAVLK